MGFPHVFNGHYTVFVGSHYQADRADFLGFDQDQNWWLGTLNDNQLGWRWVGNTSGFGDLRDGEHFFFGADFLGLGVHQILFHYRGDKNWWLGGLDDKLSLQWTFVGNTKGFGDLFDGRHLIRIGNFARHEPARMDLLFHYADDGNWWSGSMDAPLTVPPTGQGTHSLNWQFAGNSKQIGFGDLLDGQHRTWVYPFLGYYGAPDDVLIHSAQDGGWWGCEGIPISFFRWASNTRSSTVNFGNLLDGRHLLQLGKFKRNNDKAAVLFYYANDGNWWHGYPTYGTWELVGTTPAVGDLMDGFHQFWSGPVSFPDQQDILIFDVTSQRWSLGSLGVKGPFDIGPVSEVLLP